MKVVISDFYTDIYPTDEEVKELCRPGNGVDTCSWLLMGPSGWICCCKHRPIYLIERREAGEMVAMRDGCDKVHNFSPMGHNIGTITL